MPSHELVYVLRTHSKGMRATYYRGMCMVTNAVALSTDPFKSAWFESPHEAALGVMRYSEVQFVITPMLVYRGR